jgi:hypothetical protein
MFNDNQSIFGGMPSMDAFETGAAEQQQQQQQQQQPTQVPLLSDGRGNYQAAQVAQQPVEAAEQYAPGTAIIPVDGKQPYAPQAAMAGPWQALEPGDASPEAGLRSAGFSALLVTAAVGTGIALGGAWGAAAGALLAGAAANGYRAQKWWGSTDPSQKHEAMVSSVFAAAGLGVGGWLVWKAAQERREQEE